MIGTFFCMNQRSFHNPFNSSFVNNFLKSEYVHINSSNFFYSSRSILEPKFSLISFSLEFKYFSKIYFNSLFFSIFPKGLFVFYKFSSYVISVIVIMHLPDKIVFSYRFIVFSNFLIEIKGEPNFSGSFLDSLINFL